VKILSRLPYATRPTELFVRGEAVPVRPYQIVVWVSVSLRDVSGWDPRTPRLPAILDTGNNHNFTIGSGQLTRWAGIHPALLPRLGAIREGGRRITLHAADIWLHRNRRGTTELQRDSVPHRLSLKLGIAVVREEDRPPRLPLLGLRALTVNRLFTAIDGATRRVDVRTERRWWWPFG
jgi:hypothetical protein